MSAVNDFYHWALRRMNTHAQCIVNKGQRCYPTMGTHSGGECFDCWKKIMEAHDERNNRPAE